MNKLTNAIADYIIDNFTKNNIYKKYFCSKLKINNDGQIEEFDIYSFSLMKELHFIYIKIEDIDILFIHNINTFAIVRAEESHFHFHVKDWEECDLTKQIKLLSTLEDIKTIFSNLEKNENIPDCVFDFFQKVDI